MRLPFTAPTTAELIGVLSDFIDDLEVSCSGTSGGSASRQSTDELFAKWRGRGEVGAQCYAKVFGSSEPNESDELFLYVDADGEEESVRNRCASVRHMIVSDACRILCDAHTAAAAIANHSMRTPPARQAPAVRPLVSSQLTRERLLYPLDHMIPLASRMVAQFAREVLGHALPVRDDDDGSNNHLERAGVKWGGTRSTPGDGSGGIAAWTTVCEAVLGELLLTPSAIIARSFHLFELAVDVILLDLLVQGLSEVNHHGRGIDLQRCCNEAAARLTVCFLAARASEPHCIYLQAACQSLMREVGELRSLSSPHLRVAAFELVAAVEVVALYPPMVLNREGVGATGLTPEFSTLLYGEQVFELDEVRRTRFRRLCYLAQHRHQYSAAPPKDLNAAALASAPTVTAWQPTWRTLLGTSLWWTRGSAALATAVLRKRLLSTTEAAEQRTPAWMDSIRTSCVTRFCDTWLLLSSAAWDPCSYPCLLPENFFSSATLVVDFHAQLLTSAADRRQSGIPIDRHLQAFLWNLFTLASNVVSTLGEDVRRNFIRAMVSLILLRPEADRSENVFEPNEFDSLERFLIDVLPLQFTMSSAQTLRGALEDTPELAHGFSYYVVAISIAHVLLHNMAEVRTAFEVQAEDEGVSYQACFSSEQRDICHHFLATWRSIVQAHIQSGACTTPAMVLFVDAVRAIACLLPSETVLDSNALVVSSDVEIRRHLGSTIGRLLREMLPLSKPWTYGTLRCLVPVISALATDRAWPQLCSVSWQAIFDALDDEGVLDVISDRGALACCDLVPDAWSTDSEEHAALSAIWQQERRVATEEFVRNWSQLRAR